MTETNSLTPSTSQAKPVASPSSTPPAISPRAAPKASQDEAALVTSLPVNRPNRPESACMSSATARRTGTKITSMRAKALESALLNPLNTAWIRYTTRETVVTSPTSPAALICVASSPRISPLPSLSVWNTESTPLTVNVILFQHSCR